MQQQLVAVRVRSLLSSNSLALIATEDESGQVLVDEVELVSGRARAAPDLRTVARAPVPDSVGVKAPEIIAALAPALCVLVEA